MMKKWLQKIEERVETAQAAGESFGACILPDPNGGPPMCVQVDQATCTNLGGTYLGGDCGSAEATRSSQSDSYPSFLKNRV
jgi:hypothetical protein